MEANRIRKEFATGVMLQMGWDHMYAGKGNPVLGVRCLLMELSSDSPPSEFHPGYHEAREGQELSVVVNEPTLDAPEFFGSEVAHDLEAFKVGCDVIVANRWGDELADVADKVYTRNLFKRN